LSPVTVIKDAVVSHHANEDVEQRSVNIRNDSDLFRGHDFGISPSHHQRGNGQCLVE
jgi:hypothetical protein